jgi:hypothetical protein
MKSWIPLLLATGFVAGTIQMASAVDNVTVKLGSQTSSSQFFVKDSADNAVLTVNADNTTAVLGTLSVSGAATMSSSLSVTGAATVGGAATLGGSIQVTGDIIDNNSDITLNDGVIIVGAISDNDSAVFVNDDLIIVGAISDNNTIGQNDGIFVNDNMTISGTIVDNSTEGRVTVRGLAGSRISDLVVGTSVDILLGLDNSTVLIGSSTNPVLPANVPPGTQFMIVVMSDNDTAVNLKGNTAAVSLTTSYTDNATTITKTDNTTVLDNASMTLCVAASGTAYKCISFQNGDGA